LSGRRRADQLSICIASSPRTAVAGHLENKTGKHKKRISIANSPVAIITNTIHADWTKTRSEVRSARRMTRSSTCGMTSLAGRAAGGRSGDAAWLGGATPRLLGLRERRGDLGERGGTAAPPCSNMEGSIPAPAAAAPPPLALALCMRLASSTAVFGSESQCAKRLSRTPRRAGSPGAGTSGGSCRRSTCSGSALTCAAALRPAGASTIPYVLGLGTLSCAGDPLLRAIPRGGGEVPGWKRKARPCAWAWTWRRAARWRGPGKASYPLDPRISRLSAPSDPSSPAWQGTRVARVNGVPQAQRMEASTTTHDSMMPCNYVYVVYKLVRSITFKYSPKILYLIYIQSDSRERQRGNVPLIISKSYRSY
jgi:hypothetical protein